MRRIRTIDTRPNGDDDDEESASRRDWHWYERPQGGDSDGSKGSERPVTLDDHTRDVVRHVEAIVAKLPLPQEMKTAFVKAAEWHDRGKGRPTFQKVLGNWKGDPLLAKSGQTQGRRGLREDYRHEFGSLVDVLTESQPDFAELQKLTPDMRELVLHLIAAHHGRGRPHFPRDEATHPANGPGADQIARDVPRRFARLQRKYGRWGLAYLESLLRAADYAASAAPSKFYQEGES
jgi:CRISPR-associated endonuclease/helicase Cas3